MRGHSLPRLWLVTDARQGEALWRALAALPAGAGVLFGHRSLPKGERRAVRVKVERIARRRGLLVVGDGDWPAARVHDIAGLRRAVRERAAFIVVSPVFATRSHPGQAALGQVGFARLALKSPVPVIALGGMTSARYRALRQFGAWGWAAIDALTPD